MNLRNRLAKLELLAQSIKKVLPVRHFIDNGTEAQQQEITQLKRLGYIVRVFKVIE